MSGGSISVQGGNGWKNTFAPLLKNADAGVRIGIVEGASGSGGMSAAVLAVAYEFGADGIPALSFMRSTQEKRGNAWGKAVADALQANPGAMRAALTQAGELAVRDLRATLEQSASGPEKVRKDVAALQKALGYEVTP